MLTEDLKRRISALHRGEVAPGEARVTARRAGSNLLDHFPEGEVCTTPRGEVFACQVPLSGLVAEAGRLTEAYHAVFGRARRLAEEGALAPHLAPLAEAEVAGTVLIDTETAGFHGRPLFLIGLLRCVEGELVLSQYFARDYAQEAALLSQFAELLPQIRLLVSFNGKAFDWPFVRDRMVYHRLTCEAEFAHLDLLHSARRRWGSRPLSPSGRTQGLPNCRLQTLERYLCRRWRSGDIPGAEIPQRYHDFVREQEARLISPIFHHNRLDLITMVEIMVALVGSGESEAKESVNGARR